MHIHGRWLLVLLALVANTLFAAEAHVQAMTLANGLKVVVKEDHRAPVAVFQIWYKVGGSYEPKGLTGVSHMMEHMMFKGTNAHGPGEFSKIIAMNGGNENAVTSHDYTYYYQEMHRDKLPISFELEADRMRNIIIDPAEFAKERQVVEEERLLRTDNNPQGRVIERFNAVAHVKSAYRQPVVGWMDELQALTASDLRHWYQTWYAPNNATIVVVGDVTPKEVFALAEKYFGSIAPEKLPIIKPDREVEPLGGRRLDVKAPANLPWLLIGFNVPSAASDRISYEPYALYVLSGILDAGRSARLTKNLVHGKSIAVDVSADYDFYTRLEDLFILSATPAPGHTLVEIEKSLLLEIKKLQLDLVPLEELERTRVQLKAQEVYGRDSISYQATRLGELETIGLSSAQIDADIAKCLAITPEQIRAVAKKYLIADRMTVAMLKTLPIKKGQPIVTTGAGETIS